METRKERKNTRSSNNRSNNRKRIKVATSCYFTDTKTVPDYKDVLILKRFISDRGKIVHHSKSGVSSKNQRLLSQAIKRARHMALLPYTDKHSI